MRGLTEEEHTVILGEGRQATNHEWDILVPALIAQGRMTYTSYDEQGPSNASATPAGLEAVRIYLLLRSGNY